MEPILKSDIFFFISSISVVVLTILISIGVFYLIKILRDFSKISETLNQTASDIGEKVKNMQEDISKIPIIGFLFKSKQKKNKKHD
jgi:predicted transcriptional regulator